MKLYCLIVSLIILIPTNGFAMRCDGKIVSRESRPSDVRILCGEPQGINRYTEYKVVPLVQTIRDKHKKLITHTDYVSVPVNIEEWTYNFGPQNLKQRLLFENGVLQEIESLGYGD